MIKLYLDMDGTLAEWRSASSEDDLLTPGYFASLNPQWNVVMGVERFCLMHPEVEPIVLSCVLPGTAADEKREWIKKYAPFIEKCIFVSSSREKAEHVNPDEINILLDDHTPNLQEFVKQKNNYAIKLINPINGKNGCWQGPRISYELEVGSFANQLEALIFGVIGR